MERASLSNYESGSGQANLLGCQTPASDRYMYTSRIRIQVCHKVSRISFQGKSSTRSYPNPAPNPTPNPNPNPSPNSNPNPNPGRYMYTSRIRTEGCLKVSRIFFQEKQYADATLTQPNTNPNPDPNPNPTPDPDPTPNPNPNPSLRQVYVHLEDPHPGLP